MTAPPIPPAGASPLDVMITIDPRSGRGALTIGPAVFDLGDWREIAPGCYRAAADAAYGTGWRMAMIRLLYPADAEGQQK